MHCDSARSDIAAYTDGTLSTEQQKRVAYHIERCESCRSEYEKMVIAWTHLGAWEDIDPPVSMTVDILKRLRKEKVTRHFRLLLPAAAVLLISIAVFMFYDSQRVDSKREIASTNDNSSVGVTTPEKQVSEDEIISNLSILQEKEFFDAFDTLKKIDYLPLVEDIEKYQHHDPKSSLEVFLS